MIPDIDRVRESLIQIAEEELVGRFRSASARAKADGSLVTEADLASQRRMRTLVESAFPGYGFLGEEMPDAQRQEQWGQANKGLWVLDPLDGTSNFASGIPFFAISLALLVEREVHLGLVYDPIRKELFMAEKGRGAWLNGHELHGPIACPGLAEAIGLVDYKRLPEALAVRIASERPFASQRNFGAVALELCWLAAGRGHVYVHGRHHLWDYAAGLLILQEAGGTATTLEGAQPPPSLLPRSTAAALDGPLFEQWSAWLGLGTDGNSRGDDRSTSG